MREATEEEVAVGLYGADARRLASRPALRQLLAELTEAAERAVLARRPPPEERYRQLEQRLLQQLPAEEAR